MLPLLPSGDNPGAKQEQREHPAGVWGLLWRREGRQEWVNLDEADSKTGGRGEVSDGVEGGGGGNSARVWTTQPPEPCGDLFGSQMEHK